VHLRHLHVRPAPRALREREGAAGRSPHGMDPATEGCDSLASVPAFDACWRRRFYGCRQRLLNVTRPPSLSCPVPRSSARSCSARRPGQGACLSRAARRTRRTTRRTPCARCTGTPCSCRRGRTCLSRAARRRATSSRSGRSSAAHRRPPRRQRARTSPLRAARRRVTSTRRCVMLACSMTRICGRHLPPQRQRRSDAVILPLPLHPAAPEMPTTLSSHPPPHAVGAGAPRAAASRCGAAPAHPL
jgi:hypothetical protein